MRSFAISVVGRDRPGIVAAISEVLLEHGVNIADSRMTVLRGHLAMTLVIEVPEEVDPAELRAGLDAVRERLALESVSLAQVEHIPAETASEPSHIVSVSGGDHPGIVRAVSSALAERGWNITDLETRVVGEGETRPLYAMLLEVAVTEGASTADLKQALEPVARSESVEIISRPLDRKGE
jgi:glycine cleavage system transcriptional repressor